MCEVHGGIVRRQHNAVPTRAIGRHDRPIGDVFCHFRGVGARPGCINPDAHVLRGDADQGRFTVFHLKGGRIIAADSVNMPADHMAARRLVAARAVIDPETLADLAVPLKSLI